MGCSAYNNGSSNLAGGPAYGGRGQLDNVRWAGDLGQQYEVQPDNAVRHRAEHAERETTVIAQARQVFL